MADLENPLEELVNMNEAVDNQPNENGAEEGTSVDGSSLVNTSNGPSTKQQTNVDLLLGGGDNGYDSAPQFEVKLENNGEQPLVDFLSGPEAHSQGEDWGANPPTSEPNPEPLLDIGAGGDALDPFASQHTSDPSAEVQDSFSSQFDNSSNTAEHEDSSTDLLVDTSADGEINNQQQQPIATDPADQSQSGSLLEDPGSNPESQAGAHEDTGSNPAPAAGVEVKVNIDTAEINASSAAAATADLPLSAVAANSPDIKGKDSSAISLSSEVGGHDPTEDGNQTKENQSTPSTKYRTQPVLDASKEKEKQRSHYKVQTRQQRIDEITHKNQQRRLAVEERKRKQQEEEKERKEALARRSRERTENANTKRRSWSAFGSRDAPSPALSASTPRGRSAERMAERTDRPTRPASASSLGVNKRLSSSMSTVYRPVHLVRLGPNQDDWFEVHLPVKAEKVDRRSSSPGTKQTGPPRHHQSSPNLASNAAKRRMRALYTPRDIKSAQSTPTHTPRPQRTPSNTRTSPAKTTDDIKKTEKKATTPRSTRPPSPRQRPASPAAPKNRTGRGDATDGPAAKKTPARSPSPRTYGRQSEDKKQRTPGNKSQSQPPPIKKALTPTAAANSPSRTISSLRSSSSRNSSPKTSKPTTPRREETKNSKKEHVTKKDSGSKKEPVTKKDSGSKKEPISKKEPAANKKPSAPIKNEAPPPKVETTEPSDEEEPKAEEPSPTEVEPEPKTPEKSVAYEDVIIEESRVPRSTEEETSAETDVTDETKAEEVEESETTPSDMPSAEAAQVAAIDADDVQEAAIPDKAEELPSEDEEVQNEPENEPEVSDEKTPELNQEKEHQVNGTTTPAPTPAPAPVEKPKENMTEEERAKAALAERRRQAREKAEREAELERQRQEQLKREEEERERREEEERIRQEEEDRRLAEEHRKAEEERLLRAIEENKREQQRKEEEAKQKEEEEKKRQEEIAKKEEEIQEKLKKEEEERDARKKRVEEIMKRARRGAQAAGQEGSEGSTPPNDPASDPSSEPSSEPKTNGLSSSSILNNEKYKNLLINRSQLSGEEDNDDEDDVEDNINCKDEVEATTNGKQNDSISDEKEMVDGDNAADTGDEVEDSLSSNQAPPEDDIDTSKDIKQPLVPIDQEEEHPPSTEIYQSSTKVMRPSDDESSSSATSTPSPSSASSPSFTAPRGGGGVDNVNANEYANEGNENGGGSHGDGLTGLNVGLDFGMKNANNDELNANLMQTTGASSAASEEDAENAPDVGVNLSFSLDAGVKQQQATTLPEELAADAV